MAQDSFQEKTEQATPKRRHEARQKGNVPRSNEVNSAFVLITAAVLFLFLGKYMFLDLQKVMKMVFMNLSSIDVSVNSLVHMVERGGILFAMMAGPMML